MLAKHLTAGVIALAALQIFAGVAGLIRGAIEPSLPPLPIPPWAATIQLLSFGGCAAMLWLAGSRDRRAELLAGAFLLVASSFAYAPARVVELGAPGVAPALDVLRHLPADAFLPWFVWRFVSEFPRALTGRRGRRLEAVAIRTSLWTGVALVACNVAMLAWTSPESWLRTFARDEPTSHYWTATYFLVVAAYPFMLVKARVAPERERRRVGWFTLGLVGPGAAVSVVVLLSALSPEFTAFYRSPAGRRSIVPVVQLVLASIPVATAYAVLVRQVLDVRVVIRQALQYGLARGAVAAIAAVPFAIAALYVYSLRDEPIGALLSGARPVILAAALGLGALAIRLRRSARAAIDRAFFREAHDARTLLSELAERTRSAESPASLGALLTAEIDRALHPESIEVLAREGSELRSLSGALRPLSLDSQLARRIAANPAPVDVDLDDPRSWLRELPESEREWASEGGVRLLVPLVTVDGALPGVIALGPKRSELAFSREDRMLLRAVASAGAPGLESRLARLAPTALDERGARECRSCRVIEAPNGATCARCGARYEELALPHVLFGKFRLEQRLGAGGMGVVYRAVDVTLDRQVAIKTLPRTTPEDSARLRREARAMAAVAHPSLATIFGAESWKGVPLLVVEYLEGGTLADRLGKDRLSPREAVDLGRFLADALERLHGAGILHRDVKPSNVGYTRDGTPKLLDFGLAQLMRDALRLEPESSDRASVRARFPSEPAAAVRATRITEGLIGTPLYMSPEALWNAPPEPGFDLWSAAVVLFEALTLHSPVLRASWAETLDCITHARLRDPREVAPDIPEQFAEFLREALHKDRRRRPSSSREFRTRLERVAVELDARAAA